jgi:hypothetical protein
MAEALTPLRSTADRPVDLAAKDLAPTGGRYQLFEAVDRTLSSRGAPVILALDDLQWLDPSGLQLARHLLLHAERSPLLLLATTRPEGTDVQHPLAALLVDARRSEALRLVELEGLPPDETRRFAALLGVDDLSRVDDAWQRTAGNPFLLSELLRSTDPDHALPPTARDAIARRVAGLGPQVFEVLRAAAVAGEAFQAAAVLAALGRDPNEGSQALERAFAAGLILEDTGSLDYRFAHAIVREALLAVTSPTQRTRVHLAMADHLELSRPAALADIARHRHAALPGGDPVRARRAALAAHDDASDRLAFEVAAAFAGLAIDSVDAGGGGPGDRAEDLIRRGRAHLRGGQVGPATEGFRAGLDLARRSDRADLVADAVLGWAEAAPVWGREPALRSELERVLGEGVDDHGMRAHLKAKLAQLAYYDTDTPRRREMVDAAVADAASSGRRDVLAGVLSSAHATVWAPDDIEQRTAIAREMLDLAIRSGDLELEVQGLGALAVDLLEAGDIGGADEALGRHARLAERLGHHLARRDCEIWRAMRTILGGQFDDALEHVERARDLGEAAGDPAADTIYWAQRYWIGVELNEPSAMDALVEPCERIVAANPDVPAWRAAIALLHARRRDPPSARSWFDPLAAERFQAIPRDVVWLNAMTYLAEACAFLEEGATAEVLFGALEPYGSRMALIDRGLGCKGSVDRFLGLLAATTGNHDRAIHHLSLARQVHEAMDARPLAERTSRDLADLAAP